MRAGFGQASDYSGLFASLYSQDIANRERLASDLERRNKERTAAHDAEVFSKYEHGQLSGEELLRYIRSRVADTADDPTENAKWKDALRDYQAAISDQAAEDAYAAGGSIHDLIAHYRERKASLTPGTPEYSTVLQNLNKYIDEAASDDVYIGADLINQRIAEGKATPQDLADFYQRQLRSIRPSSPLYDTVQKAFDDVKAQITRQNQDAQIQQIDFQFKAGQITAQEANRQLTTLAGTFQQSDPVRYWNLLQQGQSYLQSESGGALADPSALAPYGMPGSGLPGAPGAPGGSGRPYPSPALPGRNTGSWGPGTNADQVPGFNFVTQLDGSPFARRNCVFASGAMLAQAMGVNTLNGGDLRFLSGDRAGGSDWPWLRRAFERVGLPIEVEHGMSFEAFTQRVAGGQPAVVGGNTGRLPANLHGSYIGGHAVYIDRYDPQKGFLVYDPVKRHSKGQWWSADILRAFAWRPGSNADSAVFAPRNALTSPGSRRAPDVNISVFDPPKRRNADKFGAPTPPSYGVGNDPGADGRSQQALQRAGIGTTSRTDAEGKPRPYGMDLPTTTDTAREQIDHLSFMQDRAARMADAFAKGDKWFVEPDGSKTPLTQQTVTAEANLALGSIDYGMHLGYAIGDTGAADRAADNRAKLTTAVLNAGDTRQGFLFNQITTDIARRFAYSDVNDSDPVAAQRVVDDAVRRLRLFNANLDPADPTQPEAVNSDFKAQVQQTVDSFVAVADPNADQAARQAALDALPDFLRPLGHQAASVVDVSKGVQDGTLVRALAVPRDGNGNPKGPATWSAVPAHQETLADGTTRTAPDAASTMTPVLVDGAIVWAEVVDVPSGIRQIGLTGTGDQLAALIEKYNPLSAGSAKKLQSGSVIPTEMLRGVPANVIDQMKAQGIITTNADYNVRGVVVPATTTTPAQTWMQDPETLLWYKDRLPIIPVPDSLGLGTAQVNYGTGAEIHYRPNSSLDGVYVPFSGDPKKAQAALNSGQLAPYLPAFTYRDNYGQAAPTGAAPDPRNMYDKTVANPLAANPDRQQGTALGPQAPAQSTWEARPTPGPLGIRATGSVAYGSPGSYPNSYFGASGLVDMARQFGINANPLAANPDSAAERGGFTPPTANTVRPISSPLNTTPTLPTVTLANGAGSGVKPFVPPPAKVTTTQVNPGVPVYYNAPTPASSPAPSAPPPPRPTDLFANRGQ